MSPEQLNHATRALRLAMRIVRDSSVVELTDRQIMLRLIEAFYQEERP